MDRNVPWFGRLVRGVLAALVTVTLLTAFFLAVIMGQPEEKAVKQSDQPLPVPLASAVSITDEADLALIREAFPGRLMAAAANRVIAFQSATCQDVPFEQGVARVATLRYYTADGKAVTVQSIYPARALDVMGKGNYTISGVSGHLLADLRSVRMEGPAGIRMHAQGTDALYVVSMPNATSAALRQITSAMQLGE